MPDELIKRLYPGNDLMREITSGEFATQKTLYELKSLIVEPLEEWDSFHTEIPLS